MNVERIARLYRWLEYAAFGHKLEHCRYFFLPRIRQARRVLILGEGDGRFLRELVICNPGAEVDVMEASGAMIGLARARLSARARQQVEFHHQDIRTAFLGPKPYDVAVTLFFLDCFTETEAGTIIKKIESSIRPGGFWIMGEFRQPQRGLAAVHARFWLWSMYSFFRFATGLRTFELPPYERQLSEAGLQLVEQRHWSAGMITAQLWKKTLRSEIHSLPSLIPGSPRQPAQCL